MQADGSGGIGAAERAQGASSGRAPGELNERWRRKIREGVVVSDKMDKTVVVVVARLVRHGKYRKYLTQRVRYKAHDEKNQCRVGDRVRIHRDPSALTRQALAVRAISGARRGRARRWSGPRCRRESRPRPSSTLRTTAGREGPLHQVLGGTRRKYASIGDVIVCRSRSHPQRQGEKG